MDTTTKYQLILSERQARITAEALEFYTRFCIGQFDVPTIVEFRQTAKDYRKANDLPESSRADVRDLMDVVRSVCFPELRGPGHSYGVGWNDKPEQQHAQIGYEVYKSILYEFNKGGDNVHSHPNILHYSTEPVPVFTPVSTEETPS